MEEMSNNKTYDGSDKKGGKLFSREKSIKSTNEKSNKLIDLRQECYRIFFNKWLYYYEDMAEFIKL